MHKTQRHNETSDKEKEKLKKRLQTLFKQQGEDQDTGVSNKIKQKGKDKRNQQINGQAQKTSKKLNYNANQMKGQTNKINKDKPKTQTTNSTGLVNNRKSGQQKNLNKKPKSSQPLPKNKNIKILSENSQTSTQMKNESKAKPIKMKTSNAKSFNSNGQQNMNKTSKMKAKKRTATTNILNRLQPRKKKLKLTKNLSETKLQKNKKLSHKPALSLRNIDEYDLNKMSGFVQGGDFDSNDEYDDRQFWMQIESDFDKSCDSNASNFDSTEKNEDVELYEHDKSDGSEEDYFDSDEYDEDYRYSEEEDDERYSDFDENDYEEDECSYEYSSDESSYDYSSDECSYEYSPDRDEYSSNYDFEHDENDDEYNLPEHVLEDLIIHKGTATKHDIKPEDNIVFNSDNEEAQIIELEEQQSVKVIKQPKVNEKDEILKYEENTFKSLTLKTTESTTTSNNVSDSEDCPKLVPIVDEDGFQLYNPNYSEDNMEGNSMYENDSMDDVSLGSEYMEINSDDSFLSEDINEKYLNRGGDEDSDSSLEDCLLIKHQKVDVIDATSCEYLGKKSENDKNYSDVSLNDDIQQIPSQKLFAHVDLNTKSSYLSTTIIDNIAEIEGKTENCNNFQSDTDKYEVDNTNSESLEDAEDNIIPTETEQPDDVYKTTAQNFANYNTKFYNALDSNLVLVLMKDPFYIYGTVRLTLLAGALDVYGYTLSLNKEVEIFSPRGCSVIEIASTPKSNSTSKDNLKDILKLYEKSFALADLKLISDLYNVEKDAVVLLKRNEGRRKLVQQFKKFMNENVFPNINNINMDRPLYNTEYLLRCMINTSAEAQKCLRLPTQWQQLSVGQQSRIMLTGGKGVGKSTLLRFLINRNLPIFNKILLIDLDIGQPEIFLPQTVSCSVIAQPLLGPGFLLNLQTDKSYAVGNTNIALCAHKYIEAVRSLISHCLTDEKYKELPWLINTMGYNKGFGLELISVIANELSLTDIIQLQSSKDINNFDSILFPHVLSSVPRNMFIEEELNKDETNKLDYRLHVWQSAVEQESRYLKEWEMSAKDLRYATLLARLSDALQGHAEWLTDCKPLSAPLDQIKIINLMENTATASQEELAKAIEANLVYLCRYEDANKPLECFGIGIVRGIDFHVHQLYLLPAMTASLLKQVNCLAIGEMTLPASLFTNQGSRVKNLAPFVYNTIAANSSKAIKQIYHRPRKFLKGVHKSLE